MQWLNIGVMSLMFEVQFFFVTTIFIWMTLLDENFENALQGTR
jgi:hypothetical protein